MSAPHRIRTDNSFAGRFAYDSNVPMKVFAGNIPSIPSTDLSRILDIQFVDGIDSVGVPPVCANRCQQTFDACIRNPDSDYASCRASTSTCINTCSAGN